MKLLSVFIAFAFAQNDTTPQPAPTTVPDKTTPSEAPTTPEPSPTPKPVVPKGEPSEIINFINLFVEIKVLYDIDEKPCIMMEFVADVQTPTNNCKKT